MRNERGTLKVGTGGEAHNTERGVLQFHLGPFTVQCAPRYYEIYTRYTLFANDVPIRDQISYPEEEDGWQGIAFCKCNHILTEKQLEALKEFGHIRRHIQRRVK